MAASVNVNSQKVCLLCDYWDGDASSFVERVTSNGWVYYDNRGAQGKCLRGRGTRSAGNSACGDFQISPYFARYKR